MTIKTEGVAEKIAEKLTEKGFTVVDAMVNIIRTELSAHEQKVRELELAARELLRVADHNMSIDTDNFWDVTKAESRLRAALNALGEQPK